MALNDQIQKAKSLGYNNEQIYSFLKNKAIKSGWQGTDTEFDAFLQKRNANISLHQPTQPTLSPTEQIHKTIIDDQPQNIMSDIASKFNVPSIPGLEFPTTMQQPIIKIKQPNIEQSKVKLEDYIKEPSILKIGYQALKEPAKVSREGWQQIFKSIELQPNSEKVWMNFLVGLPTTAAETFTDYSSIYIEPETIALSGFGKALSKFAQTPAGAFLNKDLFKEYIKVPEDKVPEIVKKGIQAHKDVLGLGGTKEAAIKHARDVVRNASKEAVNEALSKPVPIGGTKPTINAVEIGIKRPIVSDIEKIIGRKIIPTEISKPAPIEAEIKTTAGTTATTEVKPPITEPIKPTPIQEAEKHGKVVGIDAETKLPIIDRTQKAEIKPTTRGTNYKSIVEQQGATFDGIFKNPDGTPNLISFTDKQTGSTLALEPEQFTPENVKNKIEQSRQAFEQAKPSETSYVKGGLSEAIQLRKESNSLATYDLKSQKDFLGGQNPTNEIILYRATPTGEQIKPGDYVTNNKEYAQSHIDYNLGGKGKITTVKATLDDIFPADAPKEFWYAPKSIEITSAISTTTPQVGTQAQLPPKPAVSKLEPVKTTEIAEEPLKQDIIVNDLIKQGNGTKLTTFLNNEINKTGYLPRNQKSSLTLYHGGSIDDINSFLEKGIETKGVIRATGSKRNVISLTPDFSTAESFGKQGHLARQRKFTEEINPAIILKTKVPIENLYPDTHQLNYARYKGINAKNTLGDSLIHGNSAIVKEKIYPNEIESVYIFDKNKKDFVEIPFNKKAIDSFYNKQAIESGLKGNEANKFAIKKLEQVKATEITPIEKPKMEVEMNIGVPPPKIIREMFNFTNDKINIEPEKKVSALGNLIKYYLGTKRERLQSLASNIEKGNEWYNAARRMEVNYNSIRAMVEKRNIEIFKGLPIEIQNHIHDILKGIYKDETGQIQGGGLQPSGIIKDKNVLVGQLLTDGRIVGSQLEPGGDEYQTYRNFNTLPDYNELIKKYPQSKIVIDRYLALGEQVDKTKLGVELPAFSREVMKSQYDIKSTHPADFRYVPSVRKEQRLFTKIGNLFKSYTASGRKYKTGVLAETGQEDKDLLKTLTSKQNEFAYENLFNNTVGDILATILEPIGREGVKSGFVEVNLNKPKLKKILELKKDVLKANGIDFEKISKFQYPMNIEKEFNLQNQTKFSPEMQSVVDEINKRTNQIVGYVLSNYLIRPSTAVRNATSGFLQYNLKTLTHFYEGVLGKGFSPAIQDVKALGRAFMPFAWEELPKEILGINFYSDIPENIKLMDKALIPFKAVETYFKRASFDADLNTFANKKANETNIPANKRKQFVEDYRINYFQDLFNIMSDNSDSVTFNYSNKPYILQKISNTLGRGFVPFPNYLYHKMRMYAEYSPLALKGINRQNYKEKTSKALAGLTMFVLGSAIALKVADERKEKIKELELKKMPYEFDTTGRIKVYADDEVERWLRVYDLPFLGDTLYMAEILQKQAGIDDWMRDSLSLGPIFNTMAMFMGLRTKYTLGKPTSSVAGEQIQGFIPFGAYLNYLRILADPIKRSTYMKDYNAFHDFINPIINIVPGVSKMLESQIGRTGQEKGEERKYDIPAETMKLFFLNIRSINKAEFEQYIEESFASGKVDKRIREQIEQERQ